MLCSIMVVAIYLFLQMCFMWVLYLRSNNPSVVDVSWSIGLMVAGLIYLFSPGINTRVIAVSILLTIWALRLAGYLYLTRIKYGHVDKRYTHLGSQWKIRQSLGFFLNFQLQGILILIIATGIFTFIPQSSSAAISVLDVIAMIIIVIAIIGETIADMQLQAFKHKHSGKVCNTGLWNYSRHPNYLFDWLTWVGFSMIAMQSPYGCLSLISPLLLYVIFTRVTGPMTERASIQSRGQAYLDYQASTSMFVPWFKR